MNIHEYQAKALFRAHGIQVPDGFLARSPVEAEFAFRRLASPVAVVKAQIHAGGRGKAGGVKLVKSAEACFEETKDMLGKTLVTHQTGPEGKRVRQVYIEAGSQIAKEYYLAMLLDRENAGVSVMFSTEGGMDIEEVADKTPEKIITTVIDPTVGIQGHNIRAITFGAGLPKDEAKALGKLMAKIYAMFIKKDFSLKPFDSCCAPDRVSGRLQVCSEHSDVGLVVARSWLAVSLLS